MNERDLRRRRERRSRPRLRDRVARPQRSPTEQWMYILSRTSLLIVVIVMATVGAPRLAKSILSVGAFASTPTPQLSEETLNAARLAVLRAAADAQRAALKAIADREADEAPSAAGAETSVDEDTTPNLEGTP